VVGRVGGEVEQLDLVRGVGPPGLDLGGVGVLIPDFVVKNTEDGREALLEIVGFWRKGYLEARLSVLKEHGPKNLGLAVSKGLPGSEEGLSEVPGQVFFFCPTVGVGQLAAPTLTLRAPPTRNEMERSVFAVIGARVREQIRVGEVLVRGSLEPDATPGVNVNADPLKVALNRSLRQDLPGKQMVRAPDYAAYAGFDHLIPMGDGRRRLAYHDRRDNITVLVARISMAFCRHCGVCDGSRIV